MVTTKFYLDLRAVYPGKEAPLKLALTKKGRTALIFLRIRILPTQWDREACKIIAHPDKLFLNNYIGNRRLAVQTGKEWLSAIQEYNGDPKACPFRTGNPRRRKKRLEWLLRSFLTFCIGQEGEHQAYLHADL